MADPISGVGGRGPQALRLTEAENKKSAEASRNTGSESAPAGVQDRVELSEGVKSASTEAVFDADRVAELRQAIADGQYPLDAKRIAESFASIERLL
jgi:negative regulator of flagellin synthesis FlgM